MTKRLSETQLEGWACVVCAKEDGPMLPCNEAEDAFYGRERSQLFGHTECLKRNQPEHLAQTRILEHAQNLVRTSASDPRHQDSNVRGFCTCGEPMEKCPAHPRMWNDRSPSAKAATASRATRKRVLEDLLHLIKLSNAGQEITRHHLVGIYSDVAELMRELREYDLLDEYRLY